MRIYMKKIRRKLPELRVQVLALMALALCSSCDDEMPKDIIQPQQMENILYDYHLASIISNTKSDFRDDYKKQAMNDFVFKKHQVTAAMFDSSMIWYTRHSDKLSTIYENLEKKFNASHKHLTNLLGANGVKQISEKGDTVELWNKPALCWLTDAKLNNKLMFSLSSDSNYIARDSFVWELDYVPLSSAVNSKMALNVLFENDSVIGKVIDINKAGSYKLGMRSDSAYQIKSVSGFVYLEPEKQKSLGVLLNNISLTRYHHKNVNDSLALKQLKGGKLSSSEKGKLNQLKDKKELPVKNKVRNLQMQKMVME